MAFEFLKSKILNKIDKLTNKYKSDNDIFKINSDNSNLNTFSNYSNSNTFESKEEIDDESIDFNTKYSHLVDIPLFKKILSKMKKNITKETQYKIFKILDEINQGGFHSLDGMRLQSLLFSGIPDELPVLRTLVWKLALNYPNVPIVHTPKWQQEIDKKRKEYFRLIDKHYLYINKQKSNPEAFPKKHSSSSSLSSLNKSNVSSNSNTSNLSISSDSSNNKNNEDDNSKNPDHPLNSSINSDWNNYFKDAELLEEIHKDVRRTRAQMSFFFMPADSSLTITNEEIALKADYIIEHTLSSKNKIENDFQSHGDVLTRILYIYAKEHPDIRYVQGMNEVLAIIYYQFCLDNDCDNDQFNNFEDKLKQLNLNTSNNSDNTDKTDNIDNSNTNTNSTDNNTSTPTNNNSHTETDINNNKNQIKPSMKNNQKIEADSFNCFSNLMDEIQDLFIREKDMSRSGIQTRIKGINLLLREVDKELFNHLLNNGVEIQFFMFRWYALLFTQEYEMPDVLRLWDSILSFVKTDHLLMTDKFMFLNFLCLAVIIIKKKEVLSMDFAGTMLAYNNLDNLEVSNHIKLADQVMCYYREKYSSK